MLACRFAGNGLVAGLLLVAPEAIDPGYVAVGNGITVEVRAKRLLHRFTKQALGLIIGAGGIAEGFVHVEKQGF